MYNTIRCSYIGYTNQSLLHCIGAEERKAEAHMSGIFQNIELCGTAAAAAPLRHPRRLCLQAFSYSSWYYFALVTTTTTLPLPGTTTTLYCGRFCLKDAQYITKIHLTCKLPFMTTFICYAELPFLDPLTTNFLTEISCLNFQG